VNDLEEGELIEVKTNVEQEDVTEVRPSIEQIDVISVAVPDVPVNT